MALVRRLLWLSAFAGIVYVFWRWRNQQAEGADLPAYTPPPTPAPAIPPLGGATSPAGGAGMGAASPAGGPRRIPTRIHRGTPPGESTAPAPAPAPDEPPAVALRAREAAVGASAPAEEAQPPARELEVPDLEVPDLPATAAPEMDIPDLADLVAPEPEVPDLANLVGPNARADAAAPELAGDGVDLSTLVSPDAAGGTRDLAALVSEEAARTAGTFSGGLVNINAADHETLTALPGIGPALASRIIAYREEHGPFASVEQLVEIQGIGAKNLDEFRHLVTV